MFEIFDKMSNTRIYLQYWYWGSWENEAWMKNEIAKMILEILLVSTMISIPVIQRLEITLVYILYFWLNETKKSELLFPTGFPFVIVQRAVQTTSFHSCSCWPRDAKHRGPRSVIVAAAVGSDFTQNLLQTLIIVLNGYISRWLVTINRN